MSTLADADVADARDLGGVHAPIVFNIQQDPADKQQSMLDEEREKHKRRAERFGTSYRDPGRVRKDFGIVMEARKERLAAANHGFTTGGLDLFSPAEQEKRAARATRFQLSAPLAPSLDNYRPDEELQARARRAAKFGVPYQPTDAVLMDMDLYEQRREVGPEVERRPEAIYLYGVDVMSTKEVLSYFGEYGPVFVEWLDDSSCNVQFADANSVKRALVGTGTPLPPEVVTQPPPPTATSMATDSTTTTTDQQQQQQPPQEPQAEAATVRYQPELSVPDNLADVANLPYIWHKGRDFVKDGTALTLVYRMATVADVRDMSAPKRTRELWKAAAAGGGGGGRGPGGQRGRGGRGRHQQQRPGKRPYRRQQGGEGGDGEEEGPADMELDDGPGDSVAGGDEGDVPMKRQRGARGGQRLVMKAVRPVLQPYGGTSLLQGATGAMLPAKGHVLDYTELEDEDVATTAAEASEVGGAIRRRVGEEEGPGGGGVWGGGGGRGRGRRGRKGRGGAGGRTPPAYEGDLRDLLTARRRAAMRQRQGEDSGGGEEGAIVEEGGEGGEGEGGDGSRGVGGDEEGAVMDE